VIWLYLPLVIIVVCCLYCQIRLSKDVNRWQYTLNCLCYFFWECVIPLSALVYFMYRDGKVTPAALISSGVMYIISFVNGVKTPGVLLFAVGVLVLVLMALGLENPETWGTLTTRPASTFITCASEHILLILFYIFFVIIWITRCFLAHYLYEKGNKGSNHWCVEVLKGSK